MATRQGNATVYRRNSKIIAVPTNLIGAGKYEDGIWWGAGLVVAIDVGPVLAFDADADERLGEVLRIVLLRSEVIEPGRYYDEKFDDKLAQAFGLKSRKGLYPGMRSCGVRWQRDEVVCEPTKRRNGGGFGSFPDNSGHDDVLVSFNSSDANLGAALRECLRRCL